MSKIDDLWQQAEDNPGVPVDIGNVVVCDFCDEDFTGSPEPGGFIFQSRACCPVCTPRVLARIEANGEKRMIRAQCPIGQPFAAFVLEYRGGNNTICIHRAP